MRTKRDVVIEARLDSKDLATCARFLTDSGASIGSNSELIWLITQLAVYSIGGCEFETTQDARDYMKSIGLINLNRSGRNKTILQRNLQREALSADGFNPNFGSNRVRKPDVDEKDWNELVVEAINKLKKRKE